MDMNQTSSQSLTKLLACAVVCIAMAGVFAADDTKTPPVAPPATPPAPATPNAGGGGGGGRRGTPPTPEQIAQFRQQRMDRIKEQLGSSDDEWKALQPKVEAVSTLAQNSRGGGGFGRGGRGGGGATQDDANKPETQKKFDSLRTLLDNKDSDPKAIVEALKALRDERTKAKDALKKAQDDLKELLTPRQEAVLVTNGILE